MSLFGSARDLCVINGINSEIIGLITQKIAYYKYVINKTKVNIYGESTGTKIYYEPVLMDALIERAPQANPSSDMGVNYTQTIDFKLQRPKLKLQGLLCEPGDIIMYNEDYFEVHEVVQNQLFLGNDPDFSYALPGETATNDGENISVICKTFYVPADQVQITEERR